MGTLGEIAQKAKEQFQARAVAEGRVPASEMYADQKQVAADRRRQEARAQAEADAAEDRRRKDAAAEEQAEANRKTAQDRKTQRHQEFQAERAQQKAKRELTGKQKKFQEDQEKWNVAKKLQYADEKYQEEQKKVVASRKMPTAGERLTQTLGTAAGDALYNVMYPKKTAGRQPKQKSTKGSRIVTPQHSILDDFAGQPKQVTKRSRGRSKSGSGRRRAVVVQRAPARRDPFDIDLSRIL